MKRTVTNAIILALLFGTITGCGVQTSETAAKDEAVSAASAPAPADATAQTAPVEEIPEKEPTILLNGHEYTLLEATERTMAWQECSNLAGAHEDYHTALNHAGELEDLWVTEEPYRSTMTWTNNTQKMVGYDNVYAFYVTDLQPHVEQCTRTAESMDDTGIIENNEDWQGTGMFWYHMLMSPEIEVAADGQTAIGHWQSFGTVTEPAGMGYQAQWTCEDYNMVFVKQSDGQWKIWHLRTFVHFYTNVDNHWYEQNMATQGAGGMEVPNGVGVLPDDDGSLPPPPDGMMPPNGDMAPPDGPPGGGPPQSGDYAEMGEYYQGFDLYCVPVQTGFVRPYDTWSDIEDEFFW